VIGCATMIKFIAAAFLFAFGFVALVGVLLKSAVVITIGCVGGILCVPVLMYLEVAKWAADDIIGESKDAERW
jgi:hypothetical protein